MDSPIVLNMKLKKAILIFLFCGFILLSLKNLFVLLAYCASSHNIETNHKIFYFIYTAISILASYFIFKLIRKTNAVT